ncbi:MAG: lipid-A-disaccharide synthase [Pseudomonadota bacterium]
MTQARIFLVAAEPSGDLLGREVADELRKTSPDLVMAGIGGAEMAQAGLRSAIDTSPLSVLGLFEGLKAYPDVVRLADEAVAEIVAFKPDAVVLVDSWGFMLRVAQRLRKIDPAIRIIKLIGPQVWASRPGRAKTLAACVDHLLCIHDFEVPYYEPFGLKTTIIGNPALSRVEPGNGDAFRRAYGLSEKAQTLLVLPGSRRSEIARVAPALVEAAYELKMTHRQLEVICAPAASVAEPFAEAFPDIRRWSTVVKGSEDRLNAMAAADLALACSGTVTTELAVQRTPMIVGYKTGWITWALARGFLFKPTHITLLNIVSDDTEIVPEYVQTRLTASLVAEKAASLLAEPDRLSALVQAQNEALERMGGTTASAAKIAADAIVEDVASG